MTKGDKRIDQEEAHEALFQSVLELFFLSLVIGAYLARKIGSRTPFKIVTTMIELPGLSDEQVLKFVEVFYILDMCNLVEGTHPLRVPSLQLLRLIFEDFEEEIRAGPREFDLLCGSFITLS